MYDTFLKQAADFIFVDEEPQKADIIFVPGNGYPQNAERAAELYKAGYAPYVLPSGRYSVVVGKFAGVLAKADVYNGDYETEWEFLRDVLIKNGVPESAILKEDQATYTYENALRCKDVVTREGIDVKKAILCCKNCHTRRSLMYFQTVFPETEFVVCPSCVDGVTRENWNQSDYGIDEVTGEITRIIRQFSLMM